MQAASVKLSWQLTPKLRICKTCRMTRYRDISAFASAFAAEYKGFMKANGITNLQLAERLGRNDGYISERANGKRPLDADDIDALASLVDGWTGRDLMIELSRRIRVSRTPWNADHMAPVIDGRFPQNGQQDQAGLARVADEVTSTDESGEDPDSQ